MMHTEAEARTKWCPFARHVETSGTGASGNRVVKPDGTMDIALCLASACMAWRWDFPAVLETKSGHCGLAGPLRQD